MAETTGAVHDSPPAGCTRKEIRLLAFRLCLWLGEHVGTVHTVQGREAKIVFFVLGAQGASQNGARNWAGGRPNLVNVAVTRAQASIYVIGNRGLWKSAGVFALLDRFL